MSSGKSSSGEVYYDEFVIGDEWFDLVKASEQKGHVIQVK